MHQISPKRKEIQSRMTGRVYPLRREQAIIIMKLQRYVQGRQNNNHFCCLIGDELVLPLQHISCRRDFARFSLTYRYFSGKCSDKIHSFVHSVQIFKFKTIHAIYTRVNHPHFFRIPMITSYFIPTSSYPGSLLCATGPREGALILKSPSLTSTSILHIL